MPELRYDALAITDGETATLELKHLLFDGEGLEPEARGRLQSDLLCDCQHDCWGLVKILERLRHLAEVTW